MPGAPRRSRRRRVLLDVLANFVSVLAWHDHVRDHHIPCTGMFNDAGGHDSDWTGARNQDVFSQDRERERGMDRIAERIEYGGHVPVDPVIVMPDVGHGHRNILGECPRPVHPDALGVLAQVPPSRQAIAAPPAYHVTFGAHHFSGEEIFHVGTDLDRYRLIGIGMSNFGPADEKEEDPQGELFG